MSDPTGAPSASTPREPIPRQVVTGAWPEGWWLLGLFGAGAGAALYAHASSLDVDRAALWRAVAGAGGVATLAVGLLLAARVTAARRLYRDGALVDGRVVSHLRVTEQDTGKQVGLHAVVAVIRPDGALRVATFEDLDLALRSTTKVLVLGERAGLFLGERRVGRRRRATLRACFRMAPLRADAELEAAAAAAKEAAASPAAPVFGVAVVQLHVLRCRRLVQDYPPAASMQLDLGLTDPHARLLLPFVAAGDLRAALEDAERAFTGWEYGPVEDVLGCAAAEYVAMGRVDGARLRGLAPGEIRPVGHPVLAMLGAVPELPIWFRHALEGGLFTREALKDGLRVGVQLTSLRS